MSAAAARKKRRHQERLEAKARAALAGIVVDPVGAGIAEPSANKPGIWGQIVRDRGGADAAVAAGGIEEEAGGRGERGGGEGGAEAEAEGGRRRESYSSLGGERPGDSEGLDATDAESRGGGDKAEGDGDDDSPEPSPARRPRQYSDADDVVTTQPTGDC